MCETCGCGVTTGSSVATHTVTVMRGIPPHNAQQAEHNAKSMNFTLSEAECAQMRTAMDECARVVWP